MVADFETYGDMQVRPEYLQILQENGLGDFDSVMTTTGEATLDKKGLSSWRERVVLSLNLPTGSKRFYLKRYSHPPLKQQLDRMLASYAGTAQIEWHWLGELDRIGIKVPMAVACGVRRVGIKEVQSFLITAEIPGQSLEKWLPAQWADGNCDSIFLRELSDGLAELIRKLHGAGLIHRDLYLSHIFANEQNDGQTELYLIDLQRVLKPAWRWQRWVTKDLASLNYSIPAGIVSCSQKVRWLKQYLGVKKLSDDEKLLIHAIQRKTERIARHSKKHGLG